MNQTNWYVITGGPSSGKTTLINQLAAAGYATASEVARDYINTLLRSDYTLDKIKQAPLQLQRGILAIALKRERHLHSAQCTFFDRGTPDSLGYFRYYQLNEERIVHTCQRVRYKKVFYCHQLPMEYDSIRIEDNQSAQEISELIYAAYKELGYELIDLPPVSVVQRMNIILSHLEKEN